MSKKTFAAILLLILCMSLVMTGCRQKPGNETTGTVEPTVATTAPTESTQTEPTEETFEEEYSIPAGIMKKHPNGANGNKGIYFTMEPNDVPADTSWATEYRPATASAIQLIRGGETYNVGNTMTGMLVKYSDTEYYLKVEEWINRKYFPLQSGDVLKIEGDFKNSTVEVRFSIDTTYILFDEGLVFFSTEYPDGSVGAKVVNVGPFAGHPNGKTSTGIYATAPKNAVPATDWSVEYKPVSADVIKLIRDGKTYNIGNIEAGTLIKFGDTEYFLKMEQWIIKNHYPLRDGDIVVVDGKFANSSTGILMRVKKTYIAFQEGILSFSDQYPSGDSGVNVVKLETLQKHSNGRTATGVHFSAAKNDLPVDSTWVTEYFPASADVIKLIRDGKTYSIANVDAGTIVKFAEDGYYLKLDQWMIKQYFPIADGDILLIEGRFLNAGIGEVFEISKTYIAFANGMAYFSAEYPSGDLDDGVVKAGTMSSHPKGLGADGVYFTMAENEAPLNTDWTLEYSPVTADAFKLIRNGQTYDIGIIGRGTIVKFRDTEYYLKFGWNIGDYAPIRDGDILIVDGMFVNSASGAIMKIDKTYVAVNKGLVAFSTEYPTELPTANVIKAGTMSGHSNGWDKSGGIFFTMAKNEVPFNTDWSLRYNPTDAANIKLIRGGTTYNVGNVGAETIVKMSDTDYYLEFWPMNSHLPVVDGDVLVVEGNFVNSGNGVTFSIDKTYITVENGQLTFSSDAPAVIEVGVLTSHPNGWNSNSNNGLYFSLPANEIPYDGWNVEYMPTSAANLKLVRDGQTYNIGIPSRGTIVKIADTGYYLKLEKWTIGDYFPIVPGDMLIVEGKYANGENGVTFNVSKTSITIGEDYTLTFNQEENVSDVIQAGTMTAFAESWNFAKTGFYFALGENKIPADPTGVLEYTPVTASAIKLIRNGQCFEIAIAERGTVVKYEEGKYFLKLDRWTIGDYYPIASGDTLVVEGEFTNTANGITFKISQTSITVGEDYALTFAEGAVEPEKPAAPSMSASPRGWDTDNIYATLPVNDAPYDDWVLRYNPVSADVIKVIRDGQTYSVGNPDAETLVKFSDTDYDIVTWMFGDKKPKAGDVIIIEGVFQNTKVGASIEIGRTEIILNADGTATFVGAEAPEQPEEETAPSMTVHAKGWNADMIYGTLPVNDAPYDIDWALRYNPASADVIKVIRDGQTYSVGNPDAETLVKFSETEYAIVTWMFGDKKPIAGDVLIIEGVFTNNSGVSIEIGRTEITLNADGTAAFVGTQTEEPEPPEEETAPSMTAHPNGWSTETIYGTLAANDAPYDKDWALRYNPAGADVIKVIRDGQTYSVGNPDAETLVKFSETEYAIVTWMFGDKKPIAGDVLIIEGVFTNNSGVSIEIGRTEITLNADGTATFVGQETEEPEQPEDEPDVIQAGLMNAHTSGITETYLFFTMAENAAPSHVTLAKYKPVTADTIKLVRDGVTYDIGDIDQDTVQKYNKTSYRLILAALGDKVPLQEGDLLIVDGKFTGGKYTSGELTEAATFRVEKTYISIVDGKPVFSATDPRS